MSGEVPIRIAEVGVVPVVDLRSVDEALSLLRALSAGGLPVAEITLRTEAGVRAIAALRAAYPEALVGAGTVRSLADARRVIDVGAQFVVSPATNPELIALCSANGIPAFPGACTPTEVDVAVRAGAEIVKFFPAEAMGGTSFLRALSGPFRDVRFVPTGGIDATNLADYLLLPQVIACGGSWLVAPSLLAERRFERVEELARDAVSIVARTRRDG
jgi:2-dehydro-3-deoxyphosphogluconate aldolase / (4S)-4-hydroxy-2-oxoglutarate aldolase